MKRQFTKWMAALALLAFLASPLGMWGQNPGNGGEMTRDYEQLFSIASSAVVSGSSYKAHTATVDQRNYVITFGGNNKSVGTNGNNRSNCKLTNYSKYAVSPVTTSSTASAFACNTSVSNVTKIKYTFNGGSNQTCTNVYLIYSSDGNSYSQVNLTSGTQGVTISSGTEYTFSSLSGYFALLFEATNSSGNWRIDDVEITFYTTASSGGPYNVTYNANGGTGTLTDPNSPYQANATVTVLSNTFTKTGNTFFCWSDAQDGTSNLYDPADPTSNTFTINANTTLYAQWIPNTHTLTLPNANIYGSYSSNVSNPTVAYGTTVNLIFTPNQGYNNYIATWSVNGTAISGNSFTMPDQDVTVAVKQSSRYSKVTSANQLVPGKHYIIVGLDGTDAYAMGYQKSNNRNGESVTISNNTIQQAAGVYEFVISGPETIEVNDQNVTVYTIHDANVASTGFLYAASSGSNYLKTQSTLNDNGRWTITFNTDGKAVITAQGTYTHNLMRFNPGDPSNNIYPLFSCYGSETQYDIYLYVKKDDTDYEYYSNTTLASLTVAQGETYTVHSPAVLEVTDTITNDNAANLIIEDGAQVICDNAFAGTMLKDITAYPDVNGNAGYYLIASPIEGFVPTAANGFLTQNYDLYAYNGQGDGNGNEWINFKDNNNGLTGFAAYRGYLYASGQNTTLRFAGTLNDPDMNYDPVLGCGVAEIELDYGSQLLQCFTLVGNSLASQVTYETSDPVNFLVLNEDGDQFVIESEGATEITLDPMEAVLVYSTTDENYFYSPGFFGSEPSASQGSNVNVKVSRVSGSLLDNAIMSFNGSMMRKLYLSDNSTRVYFPVSNEDYAVVPAQLEGEQPVNFKAKENGTYVLSVELNNVELSYLHLIDNMTGADVDLLATPSYTFEAKTTDYASRFRLVFSAEENGASTGSATFAFFNGSEWIISNTGEATLQVVDVMGRILSSETVNGNATISLNQVPGVYMLRLVNGDNVQVQKIVVR